MTSNDALGLADKISFQIKYHPDALLTADEARLAIAALRSPSVPANGAGREALEDERAAFIAKYPQLDFTEISDPWGRPRFAHSHIQALWEGWKDRAALSTSSPAVIEALEAEIGMLREKLSDALAGGLPHRSDCAVYHAPAEEPGPCDCGVGIAFDDVALDLVRKMREHNGWTRVATEGDAVSLVKSFVATALINPPAPPNGETGISAVGGGE